MPFFVVVFGLLSGCLWSVLVGIIGSRRNIGFTLAFLASILFTPFVGLLLTLISDPRPGADGRLGCLGTILGILGLLFFVLFVLLLCGVGVTFFAA